MEVVKIIKDIPLEEGLYHVYIKSCFQIIEKFTLFLILNNTSKKKKKKMLYIILS